MSSHTNEFVVVLCRLCHLCQLCPTIVKLRPLLVLFFYLCQISRYFKPSLLSTLDLVFCEKVVVPLRQNSFSSSIFPIHQVSFPLLFLFIQTAPSFLNIRSLGLHCEVLLTVSAFPIPTNKETVDIFFRFGGFLIRWVPIPIYSVQYLTILDGVSDNFFNDELVIVSCIVVGLALRDWNCVVGCVFHNQNYAIGSVSCNLIVVVVFVFLSRYFS